MRIDYKIKDVFKDYKNLTQHLKLILQYYIDKKKGWHKKVVDL